MTKTARTNYIDNVRKGIKVYAAMNALNDNEEMIISYGNRGTYRIRCHQYKTIEAKCMFTINDGSLFGRAAEFGRFMIIDSEKSGKSYLYCYTFDLFKNRTTAKLNFEHITIINSKVSKD